MGRRGSFCLTVSNRARPKLDRLAVASGHSMAWVIELLVARATVEDVTHPDAMFLAGRIEAAELGPAAEVEALPGRG